jgi:type I restriction-modification system DNA methylase subunit
LGHIFEQSLTDLEELQANIENTDFDKTKSKRKKDGVFYTPEYITKYIVENTLGKMCFDKREELNLSNITAPVNLKKLTKVEQQTKDNLEIYKDWLFNLKILDPACGSGAFLNQALEYLIKEHKQLQYDLALMGDLFSSYTVEESVLEHNLYGVDINEDAVEIAKLSLWLRTAQKGRPLTNLANKIKCGNSLISDKSVVENAFVWEEEFKEVFENGGFDVIIGNPPYVSTKQINKLYRDYFWDKYSELLIAEMDLYEIFLYDNLKYKLNDEGILGFITPNSYYTSKSFENLRKYLIENTHIIEIIDFPYRFFPFEDVNTETSISILKKIELNNNFNTKVSMGSKENINKNLSIDDNTKMNEKKFPQTNLKSFFDNKIIINQTDVLIKLLKNEKLFGNYLELHKGWMSIPTQTNINEQIIDKGIFTKEELERYDIKNLCHKYLEGRDIHRYYIDEIEKYVNIDNIDAKTKNWHFVNKIILQRIVGQNKNKIFASYDNNNYVIFPNANLVNIIDESIDIRFFLSILNSTLISYFYNVYFGESNTNLTKLAFESIPIPDISNTTKEPFIQKADLMLELNKKLQELKQNFHNELKLEKLTNKLQKFENLEFDDFIKEYTKSKKIKFADKLEERNFKNDWKALFENDKKEVLEIQNQINITDKEIDQMVYKLYDLTEDEIKIVEGK